MKTETQRYRQEQTGLELQIKENREKVKMNKQLPVSFIIPIRAYYLSPAGRSYYILCSF